MDLLVGPHRPQSFCLFQVILQKLEESYPEQTDVDRKIPVDRDGLDLLTLEQTARPVEVEAIRQFLSTKNLKSVRDDSSWRSSSCFGRRMDRIGSMSSLGCNTVKHSESRFLQEPPGSSRFLGEPPGFSRLQQGCVPGAGMKTRCFVSSLADPK